MVKKAIFFILVLLPLVYAIDYYADLNIDVDGSGFVTLNGQTNYPGIIVKDSDIYTSKEQSYWILNITKEGNFSEYIYRLNLPSGASINYIKSAGSFRIENRNNRLSIIGFGESKELAILVQYRIEKISYTNLIVSSLVILLLITVGLIVKKFISKTNKEKPKEHNLVGLTSRQKKIMQLLIEKKKPLTQAQIQSQINIPKASISRNIKSLELKGMIEKEQAGMSNIIKLRN